jgi:hypothetical protein
MHAQVAGMAHLVEADERLRPMHAGLFCSQAVVQVPDAFAQLVQQPDGDQRWAIGGLCATRLGVHPTSLLDWRLRSITPNGDGGSRRAHQCAGMLALGLTA